VQHFKSLEKVKLRSKSSDVEPCATYWANDGTSTEGDEEEGDPRVESSDDGYETEALQPLLSEDESIEF
jgi:hypothetical protein